MVYFTTEIPRSSRVTTSDPKMCGGPFREKVLKWMREADTDGVVAMTWEEAFVGLCLGYLIRGCT